MNSNINASHPEQNSIDAQSKYYSICDFNTIFNSHMQNRNLSNDNQDHDVINGTVHTHLNPVKNFSLLHVNARSLNKNFESFELLLSSLNSFPFSVIGLTETWLHQHSPPLFSIDYKMFCSDRKNGIGGGVALYVNNQLCVKVRPDIHIHGCDLFIEIISDKHKNKVVGVIYRPPHNVTDVFLDKLDEYFNTITRENKTVFLMGDYNIDMTKTDAHPLKLINTLASYSFHSHINNPTRIAHTSKTLLDNIFSNCIDINDFTNGILYYDISDNLPIFTISNHSETVQNVKKQHLNYIGKKQRKILIC